MTPANTICIILGGGKGTRLRPLTEHRSKPAVPLAGRYRLIDVPLSNCINSGLRQMYVLTQFNSVSLHRHIRRTYSFDPFTGGFVEILAAQQTNQWQEDWYQGTADAVRKNMRYIDQPDVDLVLILSGDQLYRMDYRKLIETHQESGADVTIGGVPVSADRADAFGILQFDDDGRVNGFVEKPKTEEELAPVRTDPAWIDAHGIESRGRDCLANMGIYLFNRRMLADLLSADDCSDFGKEIFPRSIEKHHVQVHLFDGYWEDVGTIGSYYDANLALTKADPPFTLAEGTAPIYTEPRFLPPTRMADSVVRDSLISDGCVIERGAVVENCVVGPGCHIGPGAIVRDSILLGASMPYQQYDQNNQGAETLPIIAEAARVERCIVDRDCRIGAHSVLTPPAEGTEDRQDGPVWIRDGIVVVPRGTRIEPGWSLGESQASGQQSSPHFSRRPVRSTTN